MLSTNLKNIRQRIHLACQRSGRNPDEVTLVCVTKTVPCETILMAQAQGENVFGENRVKELCEKLPHIEKAHWHLIGHLQTNKADKVVGNVELIHSVDSLHLAEKLNDCAGKKGVLQNILLEVNISGEESKYGLTTEEIPNIIKCIENMEHLCFKGFMTMAPKDASADEIRRVFRAAHDLFEEYRPYGAEVLSMGMSGDFEIAIEEGATHVRVGSSIFKKQ